MSFPIFRRIIFGLFAGLLMIGAFFGYTAKLSLFPDSEKPSVRVSFSHDLDVSALIDNKIPKLEKVLRGLQGVEEVRGNYSASQVVIDVIFSWQTPIKRAIDDVNNASASFQSELPDYYNQINVKYLDPGIELYAAVTSESLSQKELVDFLIKNVQPQIDSVSGVSSSFILDPLSEEVMVTIDPVKMYDFGIDFNDILEIIINSRYNINIGKINTAAHADISFTLSRAVNNIEDLRALTVGVYNQQLVRLGDIAQLKYQNSNNARLLLVNGKPAITVAAWPYPDADLYRVSDDFEKLLHEMLHNIGEVRINNSPQKYIKDAISELYLAVILGILFAFLSVLFILRNFKLSIITAASMPIALILSIGSFPLFGININILSIAAIAVTIGIVIDNCVLVINSLILNKYNSIRKSVVRTLPDLLLTTLTTVIVFLPILFTEPSTKALFGDFCLVVCTMVTASFLIAVFLVPALVGEKLSKETPLESSSGHYGYNFLSNVYCKYRVTSLLFFFFVFIFSVYQIFEINEKLKKEIVAQPLPTIVDIGFNFHSDELSTDVRRGLVNDVTNTALRDHGQYIDYVVEDIRKDIAYIMFFLNSYRDSDLLMSEFNSAFKSNDVYDLNVFPWVSASLKNTDEPDFRLFINHGGHYSSSKALDDVFTELKKNTQITRINAYPRHIQQMQNVYKVNDSILADVFSSDFAQKKSDIENILAHSLNGKTLFSFNDGIRKTPVKVRVAHQSSGIPMGLDDESVVSLSDFIESDQVLDYDRYSRINGVNQYYLEIWISGKEDYRKTRLNILDSAERVLSIPNSFFLEENKKTISEFKSLAIALSFSLILILLVLYVAYGRFYVAIISFLPFPFIVAISLYLLTFFNASLTVNSFIGVMLLLGVFVNHNIVVFRDFFSKHTLSLPLAITESCSQRFRIILISSISTIAGSLPLIFDTGTSTPIMRPLGIVLVGGFSASLISMYVFTPMLMLILPRKI